MADPTVISFPLDAGFELVLMPPPVFPAALEARIDEIWAAEKRLRGDRLFNGPLYSLVGRSVDRLTLQPIGYRHALARRRAPELVAAGLDLWPVAVTGVLTCRDGVVLGRRAGYLPDEPGLWEPAPAGGPDRLDPAAQVLAELREELGLRPEQVSPPQTCGLILDRSTGVFDIVLRMVTPLDAEAVHAAHRAYGTDEYSALTVVAPEHLPDFLAAETGQVTAGLEPTLRLAGLIP